MFILFIYAGTLVPFSSICLFLILPAFSVYQQVLYHGQRVDSDEDNDLYGIGVSIYSSLANKSKLRKRENIGNRDG